MARYLTQDKVQDVFEAMFDAREKWRNIGGVFRLLDATLDDIRAEENGMDDRLSRVIKAWLRQHGGTERCTWTAVADVLDNATVGYGELARKVRERRCVQAPLGAAESGPKTPGNDQIDGRACGKSACMCISSYYYNHAHLFS